MASQTIVSRILLSVLLLVHRIDSAHAFVPGSFSSCRTNRNLAVDSSSSSNNQPKTDDFATGTNDKPILGYWKIRGLAAGICYQLAYCGVDFDMEYYEQGDGPEFSRADWMDVKADSGLEFPNLPYFRDGAISLTESGAIHRYIAKKWRPDLLCLDDAAAYGTVEMVWGVVNDLKYFIGTECYVGDGDKPALAERVLPRMETLATWMKERIFAGGDQPSFADFSLVELVELVDFVTEGEIYVAHPQLKEYRDRMFNLPGVREYCESESCPKLPLNNKVAKIGNSI